VCVLAGFPQTVSLLSLSLLLLLLLLFVVLVVLVVVTVVVARLGCFCAAMPPEEKISEKSEKCRREFFKKIEKLASGGSRNAQEDQAERFSQEYHKLFGRIGLQPMMSIKGGKRPPRYVLNRDEVWVIYKPPLWQMGGSMPVWTDHIKRLSENSTSLKDAQDQLLASDKVENLQEWHGLCQGLKWLDAERPVEEWGFVQRLDLETDGPVVIAKTWRAQRFLEAQMKEHVFSKAYMCLVHGKVENKIQFVQGRFSALSGEGSTQVMLKHDVENNPFYNSKASSDRSRFAETFFKPIAYYTKRDDGSEYSLVYVCILSGITHQIRITMQSVGHPLVSDDRYLPKEQAMTDISWCPRNFLCEVRSDWFDMCGPYKDPERRPYQRVSIENPLPKLFQNILQTKLTLTEKLDPNADLFQGCQYWALGDEQLMAAHPKDGEYRKKVMRWGERKGIHLDALDRLLLLPKEDIDKVLTDYLPQDHKEEGSWVCPVCMSLMSNSTKYGPVITCRGSKRKECSGSRVMPEEPQCPKGWRNFLADPTLHFLFLVNELWLEARRKILKGARPSYEKLPKEPEGDMATPANLKALEAALIKDTQAGGFGLQEDELPQIKGLEEVLMPLRLPPDVSVRRVRLPASGHWTYTLSGKDRLMHTETFTIKMPKMFKPVEVTTERCPPKLIISKEDRLQNERERERDMDRRDAEAESQKEATRREVEQKRAAEVITSHDRDEPPSKRQKSNKQNWKRLESSSNPGQFYYMDAESGETRKDMPPNFEAPPPVWERVPSKSSLGEYYFHNSETGESRIERPKGVEILNDKAARSSGGAPQRQTPSVQPIIISEEPGRASPEEAVEWKRLESKSKPGQFYYFNPKTGENEIKPPRVTLPWQLLESKSNKGHFYYFNEVTGASSEHPPPCAISAAEALKASSSAKVLPAETRQLLPAGGTQGNILPKGWEKHQSGSFRGKVYYVNAKTKETRWTKPEWEKTESSSQAGLFYYRNVVTGKTSWDEKDTL